MKTNQRPIRSFLLAALTLGVVIGVDTQTASAQIIVQYFPSSATAGTTASLAPVTVAADVTASSFLVGGSGLGTFGGGTNWTTSSATTTGWSAASLAVRAASATEALSGSSTDNVNFTITPTAGYAIDLSDVSFSYAYTGLSDAGTTGTWALYSSLDGYAAPIVTETATNIYSSLQSSPSNVNFTGSISLAGSSYQNLTTATTFELVFNSGGDTQAGDVLRTDNIVLNGSVVSSAPEPSTCALLAGGLAGLLWLARRHHLRRTSILNGPSAS